MSKEIKYTPYDDDVPVSSEDCCEGVSSFLLFIVIGIILVGIFQ